MNDAYKKTCEFLAIKPHEDCAILAWLSLADVRRICDALDWDHDRVLSEIKRLADLKQNEQESKEIAAVRTKYERKRRCLN